MTSGNPSPEYNFVNINSATTRCLRLLNKPTTDNDTAEHAQEFLILSAASKPTMAGVSYYRPYVVAAILLSQDLKANALIEADGVKFKDKAAIVQALLASQLSIDVAQGWIIPNGFKVSDISASIGIAPASKPLNVFPSHIPVTVVF